MGTDGNEDGISKDGGEVNERKRPYTTCRRDQPFSFRTRHHLCRQGVALASTRQLRSQGPVSVNAHRTEGVTGCVGREETNGIMGGVKAGGGNGNGNGVGRGNGHVNVDREGDGAGTRMGVETNEGTRSRRVKSGGEANMHKETQTSCGHNVENGEDLG